jgi:type II secretory pathway pseudopilin PulG
VRTTPAQRSRDIRDPEAGLGLIEIVVSMFLIGLLSIALLPLIIQGLTLTSTNARLATATQVVSARIDLARAQVASSGSCAGLTTLAAQAIPAVVDERGNTLQATMTVVCPTLYPGTAEVVITVRSGTTVVSTAETLIFVSAA